MGYALNYYFKKAVDKQLWCGVVCVSHCKRRPLIVAATRRCDQWEGWFRASTVCSSAAMENPKMIIAKAWDLNLKQISFLCVRVRALVCTQTVYI